MTQIGISTQQITVSTPLASTTSVSATISSVDLTKSYVMFQGYASGKMICSTCPPSAELPKGTADDAATGQWAVELFDATTVRLFRPTPVGAGCRHRWFIRVVEYT